MIDFQRPTRKSTPRVAAGALFAAVSLATFAADRLASGQGADIEKPGDLGMLVVELPARPPQGFDPARRGALVSYVVTGGPADRADVREGDIVLQFDHQPVTGAADLLGRIRRLGAGKTASMVIWRAGKELNTGPMTLAERGKFPGDVVGSPKSGTPPRSALDSRQDLRVSELESDVRSLTQEVRELRTRLERLEADQRSQFRR
jgi:hypothetical protein